MYHRSRQRRSEDAYRPCRFYLPAEIGQEINEECERLERSASWLLEHVWRIARDSIGELPSVAAIDDEEAA